MFNRISKPILKLHIQTNKYNSISFRKITHFISNLKMAIPTENGIANKLKYIWTPEHFLSMTQCPSYKYSIMILNRPIECDANLIFNLWNGAALRQTVDGGTNHWFSFLGNHHGRVVKAPDIVSGDFDSIRDDTMLCVEKLGCRIVKTPDQNETDFTKAVYLLKEHSEINDVVAIVESSGRVDQIMASIQTLFKTNSMMPNLRLFLMSSQSVSWLLPVGTHSIMIPRAIVDARRWCSLIPIGGSRNVTSKGLKWDLDNTLCGFGDGVVSTSNTYSGKTCNVEITTNGYLFWSMGTCEEN